MMETYRVFIKEFEDGSYIGYIACPGIPDFEGYELYGSFDSIEELQDELDRTESSAIFHVVGILIHTTSRSYSHQLKQRTQALHDSGEDHTIINLEKKDE